jgi:hypothetical protein
MLLIILIIFIILLFIKINYKYYEDFQNSSYTFIGNYYDQPIRAIPYLYPNTIIINRPLLLNYAPSAITSGQIGYSIKYTFDRKII